MSVVDIPRKVGCSVNDVAGDLRILADLYGAGKIPCLSVAYIHGELIHTISDGRSRVEVSGLFNFGAAKELRFILDG